MLNRMIALASACAPLEAVSPATGRLAAPARNASIGRQYNRRPMILISSTSCDRARLIRRRA